MLPLQEHLTLEVVMESSHAQDPIPDELDPQDSLAVFWVLQLAEDSVTGATVEYTPTPVDVRRYLEQADRPALRGVLVEAVVRLRRMDEGAG